MPYLLSDRKQQRTAGPPRLTPYGGSSWLAMLSGTRTRSQLWSDSPAGWADAATYNVWAKNCVKAISDALAQVPLKLYKPPAKKGDKAECVEDHPVLTLLDEINPFYLDQASFKREGMKQLNTFGQWVIYKQRGENGEGEPTELHILPALDVNLLRDERGYPTFYTYRGFDQYDPADIVRIYYPSLKDPFLAESPTSTAVASINRYTLADMAQEAIDKNGGRGGGYLSPDFNMIDGDAAQFMNQWNAKNRDTEYMADDRFLPPGFDYKSGQLTALEQQREARALRLMNEIFAAYGVPPAVAGDYSDASKLANADAQLTQFWRGSVVPLAQMVAESFNNYLLWSDYDGSKEAGLRLAFCFDEVEALQEDEAKRAEVDSMQSQTVVTLLQGGVITVNEAREKTGHEKVDIPAADDVTLIVNGGTQPADTAPVDPNAPDAEGGTAATASVLTSTQLVNIRGVAESYAAGDMTDRQARAMLRIIAPSLTDGQLDDFIAKDTDKTIDIKADAQAAPDAAAGQPKAAGGNGIAQARVIAAQFRKGDLDREQAETMIRMSMPDIDQPTLDILLKPAASVEQDAPEDDTEEEMGIDAPTLTALMAVVDNLNQGLVSEDQAEALFSLLLPNALPSQVPNLLVLPDDPDAEPLDPEEQAQEDEAEQVEDAMYEALDAVEIAEREAEEEADDAEEVAEGETADPAAKAGNDKRDQGGKFSSVEGAAIDRVTPKGGKRNLGDERRQAIIDRASAAGSKKKGKGKKGKKPKKTDAEKAAAKEAKRKERLDKAVSQRADIDDALKKLEGKDSDAAKQAREKLDKVATMVDKQINRLNQAPQADQVASAIAAAGNASKAGSIMLNDRVTFSGDPSLYQITYSPELYTQSFKTLLPVIDYVGRKAFSADGAELGTIEKVERFGVYGGIEATKAAPVLVIGEGFHRAADVRVMLEA